MPTKLSSQILLSLSVIVTLISSILSGFDNAFNTYALTLKETFNLTQTQGTVKMENHLLLPMSIVEVAASFSGLGVGLGFLEIFINAWFGYKFLFAFTWLVLPGSATFLSIAARYSHFFHLNPLPVYIALFLMSLASSFSLLSTSSIVVHFLPPKHTGKFVGAYMAMVSLGKFCFALIVQLFFSQDLAGFFLVIAIVSFGVYTATYLVLHLLQSNMNGPSYEPIEGEEAIEPESPGEKSVSTKEMFFSLFFHLCLWPTLVSYCCAIALMNNVTSIGQSIGFPNPMTIVYVLSINTCFTRLTCGYVIDRFRSVRTGLVMFIITNISSCFSLVIGMFYLSMSTMYIFTVFVSISLGGGYSIMLGLFSLKFGKNHYRILTGLFYGLLTFFVFGTQTLIGHLYDSKVNPFNQGGNDCFGPYCFYAIFQLMLIVTCLAIVCYLVALVKEILSSKKSNLIPE